MTVTSKYTTTNSVKASTKNGEIVARLDTARYESLSYTIHNTGDQTIVWRIYAGNNPDYSDAIAINDPADVLADGVSSYAVSLAPYRYYGVFVSDKVADTHGEATIFGITKG